MGLARRNLKLLQADKTWRARKGRLRCVQRGSSRSRARRRRQRGAPSWDPGGRRGGRWREKAERRGEGAQSWRGRRSNAEGGEAGGGEGSAPAPSSRSAPGAAAAASGFWAAPKTGSLGCPPQARPRPARAPTRAPSPRTPGTRGGRCSAPSRKCERLEPRAQSASRLPGRGRSDSAPAALPGPPPPDSRACTAAPPHSDLSLGPSPRARPPRAAAPRLTQEVSRRDHG